MGELMGTENTGQSAFVEAVQKEMAERVQQIKREQERYWFGSGPGTWEHEWLTRGWRSVFRGLEGARD